MPCRERPNTRRPFNWVGVTIALMMVIALWLATTSEEGPLFPIERSLIYVPSSAAAFSPAAVGAPVEEVWFGTQTRLHGWFVPGSRDVTILIFHGNGGNLTHRAPLLARMRHELGANLFIFDYAGYGQSDGRPSEAGTYADARAALAYLRERPDVDPSRIVYYGESLGSAVAADLAVDEPPLALVLNAPFTSIRDMAREHYWLLGPLLRFVRTRYDTAARIGDVHVSVLVIHGADDRVVPLDHGRRVYEAANEPKHLLIVPGAGHNDLVTVGGATYWVAIRDVLDR